ncbi:MAG: hypothetical protein NTX05_02895 [Fusobacteria bacterium]|nr:hypothetical protein [Fusobacteriota bacterium]
MKKRLLIGAFVLLLASFRIVANDNIDIQAVADNAQVNFKDESFSAEGGIRMSYKNIQIQADEITKVPNQPIIIAQGNVIFKQEKTTIQADKVTVNLNTQKAEVINGQSFSDKFFFGGKSFLAEFPKQATVKDSYFTTDPNLETPTYRFTAENMKIEPGNKIEATNVSFYGGPYKVLWFPYYATALTDNGGRNTLFPRFGSSTRYGSYVIWGFNYKTLPYDYGTGYLDFRYSSLLGLLVNWEDNLKFSKNTYGTVAVTDLNFPRANTQMQWNFETKLHSNTDSSTTFQNNFLRANSWDLYYQNISTNLLYAPDGQPITNEQSYYQIYQKNLWKVQLKGEQKIQNDTTVKADVSQSVQSIIQQLIKPEQGSAQNNLPDNRDIQLWTKLSLDKDNPYYRLYFGVDRQQYLNTQKLGIPFTFKNNYAFNYNLKKEKINTTYTYLDQDQLQINPLNPTQNRVVAPLLKNEEFKIKFGNYGLNETDFYYGFTVGYTNDEDNIYKYNAAGGYTEYNLINNNRSTSLTFGNATIPMGTIGNGNWESTTTYKNFFGNLPSSGGAATQSTNMTAVTYKNSYTVTTPLYDNTQDKLSNFGLKITNEIPMQYRFTEGNVPSDLVAYDNQNNEFTTLKGAGDKITTELGNLTWINSVQQLLYSPFQADWLSQKTTDWYTAFGVKNSKLAFQIHTVQQLDQQQIPTEKKDKYTLTYNSNPSEMYQYIYETDTDYAQLLSGQNIPVANNTIHNYNYANNLCALGYQTTSLYGVQNNPTPGTNAILVNQLNHYWTGVLDDQKNKNFSRYFKVTYGYGYNYITNNPGATSATIELGFIDKRNGYVDQDNPSKDDMSNINPSKKSSDSLFPDEKSEVNYLLTKDDSVQKPFNLQTVGETYQDSMIDSVTKSKYRSYTLQFSSSRDMNYAYANAFTPINYMNSYTNYALKFDMKQQTYFEMQPFITMTRPAAGLTATQAALGSTFKFQLGPTDYGYWLTTMTAYDWAPNPNNTTQPIGWSDLGIGIIHRVRAVEWTLAYEKTWNYTLQQNADIISLSFNILAFGEKGIGFTQNGGQRDFHMGL